MKTFFLSMWALLLCGSAYAQNVNYLSNRAPLANTPLVSLPLGAVEAKGWLLTQLQLQKSGQTGASEQLYQGDLGSNSAWLGGSGEAWERGPYYVKGLISLAYVLHDAPLKAKAQKWVDWVLNSQQPNGSFGPSNQDWWPRMLVIYYLRDYYEATRDSRVVPFLTKYFNYQRTELPRRPLTEWAKARAGDNIEIVLWLYNITGDNGLLDLATALHNGAYNWTDIFINNRFYGFGADFQPRHNVNVGQALKTPAVYYQKSKDIADRNAFQVGIDHLLRERGRPDGMYAGEEMLSYEHSTSAIELCGVVERMLSNEVALRILGDAVLGDQLERVAFNALPAHLSKDSKQHTYYQYPNQVVSKTGVNPFFEQNYDSGIVPGPESGFPCCRFNWHMGWPMLVKNMWMATADNGVAATVYGPSTVAVNVGNHVPITIREETNYPFDETIRLSISTAQPVSFPLKLRIPGWCDAPVIKVGGAVQGGAVAGTFYTIARTWANNDVVEITFPAKLTTSTWINNSAGVERGPLVYSLKINERRQRKRDYFDDFDEFEVYPTSPWNYGLQLDRTSPESSLTVNKGTMPTQPFQNSPIWLTAQARRLPSWGLAANGLYAQEPPTSPVTSNEQTETVTLVPYGANTLRVSNFPVLGNGGVYEAENAVISHARKSSSATVSAGQYVGEIDYQDSFVEFSNITAPTAGMYRLGIAYANGMGVQGNHLLTVNGGAAQTVTYPTTAGWGRFKVLVIGVALRAGTNVLRLSKGTSPAELDYITVEKSSGSRKPYLNEIVVPGVVKAEDFDLGGEGLAYHDADATNTITGAPYRNDGVDIEVSPAGGYNLCSSVTGEWTAYSLNVRSTGTYQIDARVASPKGGTFHLEMDGQDVTGRLTAPNTGGWQNWQIVSATATLTAGSHTLRFFIDTQEFNTKSFTFTLKSSLLQTPLNGVAANGPGVAEAKKSDEGSGGPATGRLSLAVFPNPAAQVVNLTWQGLNNEAATLSVLTLHGQQVLKQVVTGNSRQLRISGLSEGLYLVKLQSGKQVIIKKFIVSH